MAKAIITELAADDGARNGTKGFTNLLMQPEDAVLLQKGGGDLAIYRELLRDPQVKSTWEQRIKALVSKETTVEPGGESPLDIRAADELRDQIFALPWDQITERMAYGILYGYSVAEILWGYSGGKNTIEDIKVRDRSRFVWGEAGDLRLLTNGKPYGEPMPDRKFWTFTHGADHGDNPYGIGIGHQLYWPVFFKRSDLRFWLIFLEKFGQPTAAAYAPRSITDSTTERSKVLEMLQAIQVDGAVICPDDVKVELIEAARSGTADYSELHDRMDAAISKVVVGQTMTTDNGSSRSQSEVHKDVRDEIIAADADLICGTFNRTVSRWWTEFNYPGAAPPRVWRETEPDEDLDVRAERDGKIYALGYEPTQDYIDEVYGPGWQKRSSSSPPGEPLPPEFAEAVGAITAGRIRGRADQESIAQASRELAGKYREILGPRIDQLLGYLEEGGDLVTFRKKLDEIAREAPPVQAVEKIQRATVMSRLLGKLKGQRA